MRRVAVRLAEKKGTDVNRILNQALQSHRKGTLSEDEAFARLGKWVANNEEALLRPRLDQKVVADQQQLMKQSRVLISAFEEVLITTQNGITTCPRRYC